MRISQSENGPGHRRRVRKRPRDTAIARRGRSRVIWIARVQITAAHNAIPRVAKCYCECAGAGRTHQRSVVCIPGVAAVSRGQTLAIVEAPVAIQAFCPPGVATHVPLAANDASPGNAGGILLLMSCQVVPSVVRRSGKTPFTESPCEMPRFSVQECWRFSRASPGRKLAARTARPCVAFDRRRYTLPTLKGWVEEEACASGRHRFF